MDFFFLAWRSVDNSGSPIFGSLIYNTHTGTPVTKVLSEAVDVACQQTGISVDEIRVTAFNRL